MRWTKPIGTTANGSMTSLGSSTRKTPVANWVNLVDAPLVAECEWGNKGDIEDDFEKLLLARTGVRLMIFDHNWAGVGSKEIVEQLARMVREFNGSRAEDAWLLADWEQEDWSFRYFMIDANHQAIPFPSPSGG